MQYKSPTMPLRHNKSSPADRNRHMPMNDVQATGNAQRQPRGEELIIDNSTTLTLTEGKRNLLSNSNSLCISRTGIGGTHAIEIRRESECTVPANKYKRNNVPSPSRLGEERKKPEERRGKSGRRRNEICADRGCYGLPSTQYI